MDFLRSAGALLRDFINRILFKNFILKPTRLATRFKKKTNAIMSSSTLIIVLLHNQDYVFETDSIPCALSDHNMIIGKLIIEKVKKTSARMITTRKLAEDQHSPLIFSSFTFPLAYSSDASWTTFKAEFIRILDMIAPKKQMVIKNKSKFPWFDSKLIACKHAGDKAYKTAIDVTKKVLGTFTKAQFKRNQKALPQV